MVNEQLTQNKDLGAILIEIHENSFHNTVLVNSIKALKENIYIKNNILNVVLNNNVLLLGEEHSEYSVVIFENFLNISMVLKKILLKI